MMSSTCRGERCLLCCWERLEHYVQLHDRKQEVIFGLWEKSPNVCFDALRTLNCVFNFNNH